jgi:tetratricopeptide (TPR) repeat protein
MWLSQLGMIPWRILLYVNRVLVAAWQHRRRRHLIQGIPALVGGSAVIALGIFTHLQHDNLADDYRDAALRAFRSNDFKPAKLYFERLIELGGETPTARYDLAVTLSRLGADERADAIMNSLAPLDGDGFARAHVWLARRLLVPTEQSQSTDRLDTAYAHLMRAKPMLRNAPEIDWMLAQYFAAKGQREAAVPHLTQAAQLMPELNFELSLLYASLDRVEDARKAAYRADAHYRHQIQSDPYDHDARLRWASIRVNLLDFEAAARILTEGLALQPAIPGKLSVSGACHGMQLLR